jgi:pimeloyl-ACP methyl ester carboxylesterase
VIGWTYFSDTVEQQAWHHLCESEFTVNLRSPLDNLADKAIRTERVSTGPATTLVVRTCGEGEAVILIPSWVRGASDFDALMGALCAAGYRCIAVNPRGIEGSEGPLDGMTMWDMACDIAAVIEASGVRAAHVLGHAGGNRCARALATRHPDLVKSVMLLAAGGRHTIPGNFECFANETIFVEPTPETFLRVTRETGFFSAGVEPSVWLDGWWRSLARAQWLASRAVDADEWWAGGGKLMLVVQGLEDGIAPPENGRDLAKRYPERVRLVELEKTAHAMLPEQPQLIAETVTAWLRSQT